MIDYKVIVINVDEQTLICLQNNEQVHSYQISTGKNGLGEQKNSECTPRGWHRIHAKIGLDTPINSVFIARCWTGEIYTQELAELYPERDWILTRILQLDGLEPSFNQGLNVDTLQRFIYIHGTPDTTILGIPNSRGCIRLKNTDMIQLADWAEVGTKIFIAKNIKNINHLPHLYGISYDNY